MLLLLSPLLACTDHEIGPPLFAEDRELGFADGDLIDVEGLVSGVVPTVVTLTWTSPVEGEGIVEWGQDGVLTEASPVQSTGTSHRAVALGLVVGETYDLRAVTIAADGSRYESGTATVSLDPRPQSLGRFDVVVDEPGAREGGYVLTSLLQAAESWMVILDRQGDVVWYYPATDGLSIPTTLPGRDGQSLLCTQNSREQDQDISTIQRVAVDGSSIIWTRARLAHHSFVELPGDRFAWIGLDFRNVTVDGESLYLVGDTIWEIDEGAGEEDEPTEVFNYFDDWGAPYRMCQHFDAEAYSSGAQDWTHANSLMYLEEQDQLFLMSKNLDHVLRIGHDSGQVLGQMGGLESDVTSPTDDWWSHGHMSHLWDGGMVVFDNGYHHETSHSRVVAYEWEGDELRTTFSYKDPQGRFIELLGDGRLLDNGNVLSAWTSAGIISELSPEGRVVWQAESELGTAVGRVTMLDSLYGLTRAEVQ